MLGLVLAWGLVQRGLPLPRPCRAELHSCPLPVIPQARWCWEPTQGTETAAGDSSNFMLIPCLVPEQLLLLVSPCPAIRPLPAVLVQCELPELQRGDSYRRVEAAESCSRSSTAGAAPVLQSAGVFQELFRITVKYWSSFNGKRLDQSLMVAGDVHFPKVKCHHFIGNAQCGS